MLENRFVRVTRADVAREAGVTETIVSYVMNGNRYVDSAKRERVLETVKRLNYRPNAIARALKGKETNHILFIADDLKSEHFGQIISEMENIAYSENYFVSLCSSHMDTEFSARIYERAFDAIVIGSVTMPESSIQELIDTQIPIVLLENRDYSNLKGVFAKINTGLYEGERACVQELIKRGRKRLLFVGRRGSAGMKFDDGEFRWRGFRDEYEAVFFQEPSVIFGYSDEEGLSSQLENYILQNGKIPDGICCFNDTVACMVMNVLKKLGCDIPNDVSVIGFDNSAICQFVTPRLSTVDISRREIGKKVMELINLFLHGQERVSEQISEQLETNLILRESV